MVRKIVERVPDAMLEGDLVKYRQRALELGATDAKVITTDMVLIDERVRAKCIYPKCRYYGTNANCPPYTTDLDLVRKMVNNFHYAIFSKIEVPAEEIAGHTARASVLRRRSQVKNHKLVSKIEAEAYYDGYYLATGFANGSCKDAFCPNIECSALVPGQPCRHPLKGRPSMEAVGIDACAMAAKVGWNVYPVGASISPPDVPYGVRLGLVLIY